jgi:hypothetical protein
VTREEQTDLVSDLLAPIPRTAVVPAVRAALGLSHKLSDRIVQAFDDFVAKPLETNLKKLHGRDLAKRNPMIYTARGADSVEEWPIACSPTRRHRRSRVTSELGLKRWRGS